MGPFSDSIGETKKLTVGTSSASVTLEASTPQVRMYNSGPHIVFVRITNAASTAIVDEDLPIPPGIPEVITKPVGDLVISGICASGESSVLYISPGYGE
jgi:hypothetical protein